MRERRDELVIQVGSVTSRIISPFQGPCVTAKAAWNNLAQAMHFENTRYGVDTVIIQPGAYTAGTSYLPNAAHPADAAREATFGEIAELPGQLAARLDGMAMLGLHTDPGEVAEHIRDVIATPEGERPFRVVVDPQHHGAQEINGVADVMQTVFMQCMGISDLLGVKSC